MDLNLHQQLKESTRDLHRELDHHLLFHTLLSSRVTKVDIQRALQFWWGFQYAAESHIDQALHSINSNHFTRPPTKLVALKRDMSLFNVQPLDAAPRWPKVTSLSDLAALLYVSEGSMLGGVFIQRKLVQYLSNDAARLNYLSLYEPDTHQHWNIFLHQLELASTTIDHKKANDAAKSWFDSLITLADEVISKVLVYE